jgi:preprotein translocase subunit SecF
VTAPQREKQSLWWRLYHGETSFDFVGHRRRFFTISAAVILIGLVSLGVRGLNFGIDFRGGTVWQVPSNQSVAHTRDVLRPIGFADAKIEVLTDRQSGSRTLKVSAKAKQTTDKAKVSEVSQALAKEAGVPSNQVALDDVGPSWGHDISSKAEEALVIFFIVVSGYIWLRFEPKMAMAAMVALVHDIVVTVGVYSLSGFQVTPETVIAFLTILGYSLYDTVVVFDKIEENTKGLASTGRLTYTDTVNLSMNQVLMRSLNTSFVAIMPVLSILVVGSLLLGATTLQDFGLALFIGLLTGAYSSIFIASPLLSLVKEREPRYASIRQRLASRAVVAPLTPAAAAAVTGGVSGTGRATLIPGGGGSQRAGDGEGGDGAGMAASAAAGPSRSVARPANRPANRPAPRPRKKGRRR